MDNIVFPSLTLFKTLTVKPLSTKDQVRRWFRLHSLFTVTKYSKRTFYHRPLQTNLMRNH